jgi:integrase
MVATITQNLVAKLQPGSYDVRDKKQSRLVLRVRPTGHCSYLVRIGKGARRRWFTLGDVKLLTPTEAREKAHGVLADIARGKDPEAERRAKNAATFRQFFDRQYRPWAEAHLKSAASFLGRIEAQFMPLFGNKPLTEITSFAVERWRAKRLKGAGPVSAATANRDLVALKACLSKARQWGVIREHPLNGVKRAKEDNRGTVRYLNAAEETRLRQALTTRDDKRRAARAASNQWRIERGYKPLPNHGTYTDHLTPIVLLALNTGLRRGELLNLAWKDVDIVRRVLTVRGDTAKSGRTRHVPLNDEAREVLDAWGIGSDLVFPGPEGRPMTTLKTAWLKVARSAKLKNFRFHDLRHTFASKLVQRGVDLNTVRELLGHSDFSLTLRYAHLAAENKAAAVAKLAAG